MTSTFPSFNSQLYTILSSTDTNIRSERHLCFVVSTVSLETNTQYRARCFVYFFNNGRNDVHIGHGLILYGSQCIWWVKHNSKRGHWSRMSARDAKAQEPRPEFDIIRTSSWAWAIATSKGGFRGLLFDSEKNI